MFLCGHDRNVGVRTDKISKGKVGSLEIPHRRPRICWWLRFGFGMSNFLEQLCDLVVGSIQVDEEQKMGLWYQIPNQMTRISDRNLNSTHPCILFETSTLTAGYAEIWIRSSTLDGDFPEYVFHKSHIHSRSGVCPLDRDGHIGIKLFKRIPAIYITRISPRCKEVDQDWLKTFEKCCLHVIGRSRLASQ